ncbi:MAG TPA: hypothetical protein VFB27_12540 [Opitutaceae bacterium]|nr:hypothetical protein [Opitutaceae bacterium]
MIKQERIPLVEGLRRYWRYLIPLALFPTAFIVAIALFPKKEEAVFLAMTPFFFASGFCAGIPHRRKNVSYSFWIFACVMWMFAFIPAVLIAALIGLLHRP